MSQKIKLILQVLDQILPFPTNLFWWTQLVIILPFFWSLQYTFFHGFIKDTIIYYLICQLGYLSVTRSYVILGVSTSNVQNWASHIRVHVINICCKLDGNNEPIARADSAPRATGPEHICGRDLRRWDNDWFYIS